MDKTSTIEDGTSVFDGEPTGSGHDHDTDVREAETGEQASVEMSESINVRDAIALLLLEEFEEAFLRASNYRYTKEMARLFSRANLDFLASVLDDLNLNVSKEETRAAIRTVIAPHIDYIMSGDAAQPEPVKKPA